MELETRKNWLQEFQAFLGPFLEDLGHKARRKWCPLYIQGLYGNLERKSLRPIADFITPGQHEQLHHFVSSSPWDPEPLEDVLAYQAKRLVGKKKAVLIVDDTSLPKSGRHSVGVAHQYCGVLGKMANCQTLVSLTLAKDELPVPIGLRLFLPQGWTKDPKRCTKAGVPKDRQEFKTKLQIALEEVDRVMGLGVQFDVVLADAGYGNGTVFRQGLSERGLSWVVGIQPKLKVYPVDAEAVPISEEKRRGRPQKYPEVSKPGQTVTAELEGLSGRHWREVMWRIGRKGPLKAKFAVKRVRIGDGEKIRDGVHLPGEEVWLIGEQCGNGEQRFYVSNLPSTTTKRELVQLIKRRFWCELAHQQLKGELGLDHFEGRSWLGLHHHALLCMIALAFLQKLRCQTPSMTIPILKQLAGQKLITSLSGWHCPTCGRFSLPDG